MTIGVVAALAAEGRALRGSETAGALEQILLQTSGVGAAAATRAAETLIRAGARALVSWGVAGALDPALAPGAICLPAAVLDLCADARDGNRFSTHAPWRATLAAALRGACAGGAAGAGGTGGAGVPAASALLRPGALVEGLLLSGVPQALATVAAKRAARASTGAVAVDMESAAVARVAERAALPFIALRVIVDTAADEIPGSIVAASRAGRVRMLRLVAGLLIAPTEVVGLVRLARRYRCGLDQLRAVARACPLAPLAPLGPLAPPGASRSTAT